MRLSLKPNVKYNKKNIQLAEAARLLAIVGGIFAFIHALLYFIDFQLLRFLSHLILSITVLMLELEVNKKWFFHFFNTGLTRGGLYCGLSLIALSGLGYSAMILAPLVIFFSGALYVLAVIG
ncbi:MAG: hypothetical protein ACTSYA_02670 [Candidatus Kariarchaeaceae archaeon]